MNFVWNYCNGMQSKAAKAGGNWLGYYDLARSTAGSTKKGLQLHAQTVRQICKPYDASRQQHRKPWLARRKSKGARRSLGWVPFNQQAVQVGDGGFAFRRDTCAVFLHRPLPENAKIGCGWFSEESRGHWYINVPVEVADARQATPGSA